MDSRDGDSPQRRLRCSAHADKFSLVVKEQRPHRDHIQGHDGTLGEHVPHTQQELKMRAREKEWGGKVIPTKSAGVSVQKAPLFAPFLLKRLS